MSKVVTTIGGGTGTPIVNEALLYTQKVNYIHSIVTVMDSGGLTGRMRTDSRGQEIAYSDALRTLLSLIDPAKLADPKVGVLKEILVGRNDRHHLGYEIFSHFFNRANGFGEIQKKLEILIGTKFKGEIIPVTLKSSNIVFRTKSGTVYRGEHEMDDKRMSADTIADIWLDPPVSAYKKAVQIIENSDIIFFSCGSLHGSVLVNFLPKGIKEALKNTKAKKVLITNLVSTRNETHQFSPADFIKIFQKYTKLKKPIDVLVVPDITKSEFEKKNPDIARRYANDHSFFLGWDKKEFAKITSQKIQIITHSATTIDPVFKRIRHDPKKLAHALVSIL